MSRPGRFSLVVLVLVILAVIVYGLVMIRHGFSAREQPSALEGWLARSMRRLAVPADAKAKPNPIPATPEAINAGLEHFADHCAICHANNGNGQTEIGQNLYPKAPDMRRSPTQDLSDGELYYIIQNGIRLTGMPAWGKAGEESEESWRLVHFIRHLPKLTLEEERRMEQLNPRSSSAMQDEQSIEEFLGGQDVPAHPTEHNRKH